MTTTHAAPPTLGEWIDRKLRSAILSGELAPGERLVVAALADRWQVSPTPLREAFQRLAAAGLVELTSQRGARVTAVSAKEMHEIYELRELLEPLALERSLSRADDSWRQLVGDTYERLIAALRTEDIDLLELEEHHRAFHRALLSGCDSDWLLRMIDWLSEHSVRYRLLSLVPRGGHDEVVGEHERLRDACLDGDSTAAISHLRRHLGLTVESIADQVNDNIEKAEPTSRTIQGGKT